MSRAYRIRVGDSLKRVIRAEDHVRSEIEILAILAGEQMAELLGKELQQRGFVREENRCISVSRNIEVVVDLESGEVTVSSTSRQEIKLSRESTGVVYDDARENRTRVTKRLKEEVAKNLERDAELEQAALQKQVTEELEAKLGDLRSELDQAVNRATAEALKQKAAQIGRIKEITDDAESGSLTIVVEV